MPIRLCSSLAICLLLAACQQPASRVSYKNGETQKQFSDEVIKVPTRSVAPYASNGSAGKEAASYYGQQRQPAARIGAPVETPSLPPIQNAPPPAAAQRFAPPQPYNPAPARPASGATPFGSPSAPLSFDAAPESNAAEPTRTFSAASGAPIALPSSLTPSTSGPYTSMLSGSAPAASPVSANDPYAGSIALGGAYGGALGPANVAAPSLPSAAPVAAGTPAPPPSDFVINGSGDTLKGGAKTHEAATTDQGSITQAEAAPVITPVSTVAVSKNSAPMKSAVASEFIWPTRGPIISGFGPKGGGKSNDGINIGAPAGTPIHAAADGMVVYAGNQLQGYGNMAVISHDGGKSTVYAHASALNVKKGDLVHQGQTIGFVGQTGGVSEPQLHFAMRTGSEPVNPLSVLKK